MSGRPTTPLVGYRYLANLPAPAKFEKENTKAASIMREERALLEKLLNSRNANTLSKPELNGLKARIQTLKSTINHTAHILSEQRPLTPPDQIYRKKMIGELVAYKTRTSWKKLKSTDADYLKIKDKVFKELPMRATNNAKSRFISNSELIKMYNNPSASFLGGRKTRRTVKSRKTRKN